MRQKLVCRQKVRIEEEKRITVREIFRKRRKQQIEKVIITHYTTFLSSLRLGSPHTMLSVSPSYYASVRMRKQCIRYSVFVCLCACLSVTAAQGSMTFK